MNDSKDFQDADFGTQWKIPSRLPINRCYSLKHPMPEGFFEAFLRIAAPQRRNRQDIWGYTWYIGKTFFQNPHAFLYSSLSSRIESMGEKTIEEPLHMSTAEKSGKGPETESRSVMPVLGPSAKDSVHLQWRRTLQKNYGADQQRPADGRISTLTSFPTPANLCLLEDKVSRTEVRILFTIFLRRRCNGSRKWSLVWFSGWN